MMRTYQPKIFEPSAHCRSARCRLVVLGISFLEMLTVLVIVSLLFAVGLPAIRNLLGDSLDKSSAQLASIVEDMRFLSIFSNQELMLRINPEKNTYQILVQNLESGSWEPHPSHKKPLAPTGEVEVAHVLFQTVKSEVLPVDIRFSPLGYNQPFQVSLRDDEQEIVLAWKTITGTHEQSDPKKYSGAGL